MKKLAILALFMLVTALSHAQQYVMLQNPQMMQQMQNPMQMQMYNPAQMQGFQGNNSMNNSFMPSIGELASSDPSNIVNCQCALLIQKGMAASDPTCANFAKALVLNSVGGQSNNNSMQTGMPMQQFMQSH